MRFKVLQHASSYIGDRCCQMDGSFETDSKTVEDVFGEQGGGRGEGGGNAGASILEES